MPFARPSLVLALLVALACSDDGGTSPVDALALELEPVATGLEGAVHLASPPGDERIFVVERAGRVRIVRDGALLATPFLDISSRVTCCHEQGLLSIAFDPRWQTTGYFYLFLVDQGGDIAVERFTADPESDVTTDAPTPVLSVGHPSDIHHGGLLQFGPDGMLYISTGDGQYGDPAGNAQNLGSLLGKILRIDVTTLPYAIPEDNPFAGEEGRRGEIWAYGLRNPWRYDVVPRAGAAGSADLYVTDVGHERYEELNVVPENAGGSNFGWRIMEASHCYPAGATCETAGLTLPTHEYSHAVGCSIIGGHVYRGSALPELAGHYFFADYCEGWLKTLAPASEDHEVREWTIPDAGSIHSFGVDAQDEPYLLTGSGTVYRIVRGAE